MSLSLYAIREDYELIMEQVRQAASENDGVIPAELDELLESVEADLELKIVNCGHAYKNRLAEAEAIRAEEKNLAARRKSLEGEADWLRRYIERNCTKGEKFTAPTVSISWRKSKAVEITDESLIPEDLCKIKVEPSKTLIKAAIDGGQTVPGAAIVENLNLQIK